MEKLIKPVLSLQYELALKIITNMLRAGVISKSEFDKIDRLNRDMFVDKMAVNQAI